MGYCLKLSKSEYRMYSSDRQVSYRLFPPGVYEF